jgi:hypothetical protein
MESIAESEGNRQVDFTILGSDETKGLGGGWGVATCPNAKRELHHASARNNDYCSCSPLKPESYNPGLSAHFLDLFTLFKK